jgi:predicted nuclease of predicted toxin-antitoxin system
MAKYLVDANLPYYFGLWDNSLYIHVKDIDETMSDNQVWKYAQANNLIIITKDADFSLNFLLGKQSPKVIHIRIGNMKIRQFHEFISKIWQDVEQIIKTNSLINVYENKIEVIR